jgi:hypothetical protein
MGYNWWVCVSIEVQVRYFNFSVDAHGKCAKLRVQSTKAPILLFLENELRPLIKMFRDTDTVKLKDMT